MGRSSSRLPWLVIAPFLVALALMAALGVASAEILSAVRAYVGGESLWSKGQKDAVYQLTRYAASGADDDYRKFRHALAVPLGDRQARVELERADPDFDVARQGFLAAGNHPDDVASMIWLFRNFSEVDFMARAIAIWAQADVEIAALDALADRVRLNVTAAAPDPAGLALLLTQVRLQNDRLTLLAERFSATLGEASRTANGLVLGGTLLLALVLVVTAGMLSLRPLRRQAMTEAALRISEERLQRALDAAGLALWDFDVDSGDIYLSESWSQALGGAAVVTHTSFAELADLVPEQQRAELMARLIAALKDPQSTYRVEHQVRKPDGEWLWNLSEGRVVERSSDGRAVRMVGTNRDITERKLAEDARRGLEAQLRESQKMEAIGTLAGGIAHDFNNFIGAILGNVALASGDLDHAHPAQVSLGQIHKAALRTRELVQQILAYSRRQPQQLLNRPLRPLVQETLALMRSTLPAGVALDAELADEALHVLADGTQIQQVLMNLCTNAWHALQGQPGQLKVGLEAVVVAGGDDALGLPAGSYAHLWVSDSGCGMDVPTQARIFEPFFTSKPVGQGTGLGLSVAHGIVAAHHGAITVHSRPGHGSTFHIHFPLLQALPAEAAAAPASPPAPAAGGDGQHVMYIDDDEVMLMLVDRLLGRLGYRVSCFQDPWQAIAAVRLQADAVDLVVSDFNMPQCSGIDVARELARIRADLPVLLTSGHITAELHAAIRKHSVRGVMQKENTVEELGGLVRRTLQAA